MTHTSVQKDSTLNIHHQLLGVVALCDELFAESRGCLVYVELCDVLAARMGFLVCYKSEVV